MDFKHHQLANGLTLLAECDDQAHTSAVGFFVRTGARDEPKELMGVSHFLEHMMFKGTDRRSAEDVNRDFDRIGADYNAFTSHEITAYWAHVLPEYFHQALDLIGDMLRPALRPSDFEMEKKVILEEIGMYDDRPTWRLQDSLLETYHPSHGLGHRVLGTNQTVSSLTAQQMRDYFDARYGADRMVVAAAGKIDFDRLRHEVEQLAESWTPAQQVRDPAAPMPRLGICQSLSDARVNRHYAACLSPAPDSQDARRYAAMILSEVLGDSDGSKLYWALIDPGLADEAGFAYDPQDGTGCFMGSFTCDPARADQVRELYFDTLLLAADEISDDDVLRAKNKVATHLVASGELPLGRMNAIAGTWAYLQEYIPLDEVKQRVMSVQRDDLLAILRAYPLDQRTLVELSPAH